MKKILNLLLALPLTAFCQHSDMWKSMEADERAASIRNQISAANFAASQNAENISRKIEELNRTMQTQTSYPSAAISPQLLDFIQQKEVEFNKLQKKYNALLLISLGQQCSDKQAAFDAMTDQSQTAVSLAFPCREEKSHPINALVDKIFREREQAHDPSIIKSDCPWVLYSEAARQLGIKPLAHFGK